MLFTHQYFFDRSAWNFFGANTGFSKNLCQKIIYLWQKHIYITLVVWLYTWYIFFNIYWPNIYVYIHIILCHQCYFILNTDIPILYIQNIILSYIFLLFKDILKYFRSFKIFYILQWQHNICGWLFNVGQPSLHFLLQTRPE